MTTSRPPASTGPGTAQESGASTGELLRALTDDVRTLVRQELRSAQDELAGTARRAGTGAAMLGGSVVLGALAAGTSAAVVTRALERYLPRTAAALLATALFGGGAAALAGVGIEELRRALPIAPQGAVDGLRADLRSAADRAPAQGQDGAAPG
ncbi:phage holin family protein [Pseudonocardia sp. KRD-184]|uniref:Phage holin family protein n=1 Tax=Pseudonocardia oceani TaxID=2792013 RepID=A0ABS6UGA1_9PSEU|nr:phage holin family protein [Pseudonocardia oceani]MBW0093546.1 phage holin family protein [Pseudonocardia oceani]MBW0100481.1 phage holin family protein [Pseudonocardia oceani]MBW0113273.1 phage holin family protein [Pseudonocardia oceani]MBW0125965.1 phage holin family protein [Pseudonocardia oceani]MBW0131272.1 phage holin family protein [Pseudonocardia oceani]